MSILRAMALGALLSGCTWITGEALPEQTVTAACGLCIFHQPSPAGCYWAIEHEGRYLAVNGPTPADHDSHGPEGMCTMPRKAVVAGTIRGDQLIATKFELLPVDPADRAAAPPPVVHDHKH